VLLVWGSVCSYGVMLDVLEVEESKFEDLREGGERVMKGRQAGYFPSIVLQYWFPLQSTVIKY
jgi:hypothetical protein